MLLVPHYVGPSAIAGVGLFTAIDLPAGTPVYRCDPRTLQVLEDATLDALPDAVRPSWLRYLYRGRGSDRLVAGWYYCLDDARFFNHAEAPNCRWEAATERYLTTCDLSAGSELTCDYRDFSEPGDFPWLDALSDRAVPRPAG